MNKQKDNQISSIKISKSYFLYPLFLLMIYSPFLYYILITVITYIAHREYFQIESKFLKKLFTDQFSDSTSATLISSPFITFIFLLLPLSHYLFPSSETLCVALTLFILLSYRFLCFLKIYNSNSITDFELKSKDSTPRESVYKMKNPMPERNKKPSPSSEILNHNKVLNSVIANNDSSYNVNNLNNLNSMNYLNPNKNSMSTLRNVDKRYVAEKMFISTLIVISLDFIFLILYVLPLCYGLSIHHLKNGFTFISFTILIAYSWQIGEKITNKKFGINKIGEPIAHNKTVEGIYGGIILSAICCYLFKYFVTHFTYIKFFGNKILFALLVLEIISSILGECMFILLTKFIDIKGKDGSNSFIILNNIDSVVLGIPICYSFMKFIN